MNPLRGPLLLAIALSGCQSAKFIRTDSNFTPTPRNAPPTVWIDVLPPMPCHHVGTIEVVLGGDATEQEFVAAAISAGQQAGCDVILDAKLAGLSGRLPFNGRVILVHEGGEGPPSREPAAKAKPDQRRNFVCGITIAAPST